MENEAVVYDACVLYPATLRSFLIYLALRGIFRARWTEEIHDEWIRNVSRKFPDINPARLQHTRQLMNAAVPDCLVKGYQHRIGRLTLPDPDDRHVLAAAIHCGAKTLVTINKRHFPKSVLAPFGIEAFHPDDFVMKCVSSYPSAVIEAARVQRGSHRKPVQDIEDYLASLDKQGLHKTVAFLSKHTGHI